MPGLRPVIHSANWPPLMLFGSSSEQYSPSERVSGSAAAFARTPPRQPGLVLHFVETFSRRMGKPIRDIPPETLEAFTLYSWPGNVRELQNLIERAVIKSNDGVLPNPLPATEDNPVTLRPAQGTLLTLREP